jgi:hypothetical protein
LNGNLWRSLTLGNQPLELSLLLALLYVARSKTCLVWLINGKVNVEKKTLLSFIVVKIDLP